MRAPFRAVDRSFDPELNATGEPLFPRRNPLRFILRNKDRGLFVRKIDAVKRLFLKNFNCLDKVAIFISSTQITFLKANCCFQQRTYDKQDFFVTAL